MLLNPKQICFRFDPVRLQFLSLIAILLSLFLSMTIPLIGDEAMRLFVPMISAFFFGVTLLSPMASTARRVLFLAVCAMAWFFIAQVFHFGRNGWFGAFGGYLAAVLVAFPFASVAEDADKRHGLHAMMYAFVAFSAVYCLFSWMLCFDLLPASLTEYFFFRRSRLVAYWHPNGAAYIFMLGTSFSLYLLCMTRRWWGKVLSLLLFLFQLIPLSLTVSRTGIALACVSYAGLVFFGLMRSVKKRNINRFLIALIISMVVLVAALFATDRFARYFFASDRVSASETEYVVSGNAKAAAPIDTVKTAMYAVAARATPAPNAADTAAIGGSDQQTTSRWASTLQDFLTLNLRTSIWSSVLRAAWENPMILLTGTEQITLYVQEYTSSDHVHTHNSYLQVLMHLGIPGLLFALFFTFLALRGAYRILCKYRFSTDMRQKYVALLLLLMLAGGFMEPYLFTDYLNYGNIPFFLCLGYVVAWSAQCKCDAAAPDALPETACACDFKEDA